MEMQDKYIHFGVGSAQGGMAHIICVEGNFKIPLGAVAAATTSQ